MKVYNKSKNVYEASKERLSYLFNEFEQIVISFSGGKDSGVLLNLALDYATETNQLHKVCVYHMDYEAQYQMTTDYVTDTFNNLPDKVRKFWVCLPIKAQCSTSMFQNFWQPWHADDKNIWCRELPKDCINESNHKFDFDYNIADYDFNKKFAEWISKEQKTCFLIGIRSQESLNRFRTIAKDNINRYNDLKYTTKLSDNCINAYPIYDWETEDIWTYNYKFMKPYNKLYDLYYQAGLTIHQMRVASPFNDCAKDSLKVYKVIDANNWGKMISRVNGVNFTSIYGGTTAMGWGGITKPNHFTWKEYMYFLLNTLPEETKNNYIKKLEASKKSWLKGGARDESTILELEAENADFKRKGEFKNGKEIITFDDYLDDTSVTDFSKIPSYKRMCVCIMKNDYHCKYMGFAQNKSEKEKRKNIMEKYKKL